MADSTDVRPAEALQFTRRHLLRVADDATLATAQRDVHHGGFPGHPRRQGPNRIDRLLRVETDATFRRASRVVVLDTEAVENLDVAVVHANWQRHVKLAQRPTQQLVDRWFQAHDLGCFVQLCLGDLEGVQLTHFTSLLVLDNGNGLFRE
jgi:hypothetical protein